LVKLFFKKNNGAPPLLPRNRGLCPRSREPERLSKGLLASPVRA